MADRSCGLRLSLHLNPKPQSLPLLPQAMGTLHGRWKLVYTSNTRTLMLLNAIQSFPMVSVS